MFNKKTLAATQPIWSWEERNQQCYAVNGDLVECMTVQSAWRSQGSEGESGYIPAGKRDNGETFLKMWARAREFGPQIVLCPTWNEYSKGEQPTPDINKDLEPTNESGTFYYDILKEQIKLFKNIKSESPVPADTEPQQTEPVTGADDTAKDSVPQTADTEPDETKPGDGGKKSNLKPFLYTAAAVVLAAVIAAGAMIFRSKKNSKRQKKAK